MYSSKEILLFIIKEKAQGNTFQELNIQMKMMLKGINVKGILEDQIPDNPALKENMKVIAKEFEVDLAKMA